MAKSNNGCPIDPEDSSERWTSTKVESNKNYITGHKGIGAIASPDVENKIEFLTELK